MGRRFVKEFANYLLDFLYPEETKKEIRKVVYDYEVRGAIIARQAMYQLVDIAREKENPLNYPHKNKATDKDKMLDFILNFAMKAEWGYEHTLDQLRSFFTTWCFLFDIESDTRACDEALQKIYFQTGLEGTLEYNEEILTYEDFYNYMVGHIV